MGLLFNKRDTEIGDKGFIVGDRFIHLQNNGLKIPERGLVFYAPLSDVVIATDQSFSTSGTITYQVINGIPCGYFNGNARLYGNDSLIQGNNPFSVSIWTKSDVINPSHWFFGMGVSGGNGTGFMGGIRYNHDYGFMFGYYDDENTGITASTEWYHLVYVYDGTKGDTYVNGEQRRTYSEGSGNLGAGWTISGCPYALHETWIGYISSVRIYNRVLTQSEIMLLSREFKI